MNKTAQPTIRCRLAAATVASVVAFAAAFHGGGSDARAATAVYPSPEKALDAFRSAVMSEGNQGLIALFGPEHQADLVGGDPAEARLALQRLRAGIARGLSLVPAGPDQMTVVIGNQGWPMPIPLVKGADGWTFDVAAGIEEITDRRIGNHELAAIALCRAYLTAQVEYAAADHDGDQVLEYAQRLASTPGQQDGLYWQESASAGPSPFGPLAASAEEYLGQRKAGEPYRGYHFRILTGQGANPPGGKYDYVINGNMIAGYALLAWPADYGRSGIMTFQCSHQGMVFEKNLGENTAKLAAAITAYDPDKTWEAVAE